MANITLFAQIISQLPKEKIRRIIKKPGTDNHSKGYNTWSQFVSMIFSQFSGCDSVRGISNGLKSATGNLNHLGISRAPSKSTVAYRSGRNLVGGSILKGVGFLKRFTFFSQAIRRFFSSGKFAFLLRAILSYPDMLFPDRIWSEAETRKEGMSISGTPSFLVSTPWPILFRATRWPCARRGSACI